MLHEHKHSKEQKVYRDESFIEQNFHINDEPNTSWNCHSLCRLLAPESQKSCIPKIQTTKPETCLVSS